MSYFQIYTSLGLLIQDMKPDINDLNEEMPRSKWLGKVNRFRPLVENVMSLAAEESEIPITKKNVSMHEAR